MLKPFFVLPALFFMSPYAMADIYQCARENGSTVYQNFPCNIDSIGSKATAAPPPDPPASVSAAEPVKPKASKTKVADAEKPLGTRTEPRVGMTKAQVKASTWGEPIDIVGEEVIEGWTYAWYYDLQKKRSVLFDVRGRVSEVTQ